MPGAPEPPDEPLPRARASTAGEDTEPWVPSGGLAPTGTTPPDGARPTGAPPPDGARPTGPLYTLARKVPAGPVRRFLSLHEVHILPHSVEHARRARRIGAVVLVALLGFGAWYYVIPHSEVRLQAQYHEGLFNTIAVDLRLINDGSLALAPLHVELVVTDAATHAAMGFYNVTTSLAAHGTWNGDDLAFKGDQIATNYTMSIVVRYTAGSLQVSKTFDFRTEEPFMNLYYEARVS